MRRYSLPLVILAAIAIALVLTWLALGGVGRRDRDEIAVETRTLAPFKRIQLSGSTTVNLVQDTNGPLVIGAASRNVPRVTAKVQDDTLIVFASDNFRWWRSTLRARFRQRAPAHDPFQGPGRHRSRRRRPDSGARRARAIAPYRRLGRHVAFDRRPARVHAAGNRRRRTQGRTGRRGDRPEHLRFRRWLIIRPQNSSATTLSWT